MLLRDVPNRAATLWPDNTAIIDGDVRYTYRSGALATTA